ncbi:MAG: hypothetical protein ACOY45_13800 [Pseudomonadota bacterium]
MTKNAAPLSRKWRGARRIASAWPVCTAWAASQTLVNLPLASVAARCCLGWTGVAQSSAPIVTSTRAVHAGSGAASTGTGPRR